MSEGIWTMTDSEFTAELNAARAEALKAAADTLELQTPKLRAHIEDRRMSQELEYIPGAVVKYRGKMGMSWIAWAGHDLNYEEVWYCQRRDSVCPSVPRAVSHAALVEEIGTIEDLLKGDIQ